MESRASSNDPGAPRAQRAAPAAGLLAAALVAGGLAGFLLGRATAVEVEEVDDAARRGAEERLVGEALGGRISPADEQELRRLVAEGDGYGDRHAALAALLVVRGKAEGALDVLAVTPPGAPEPHALARIRVAALRVLGRIREAERLEQTLGEPTGALEAFLTGLFVRGDASSVAGSRAALPYFRLAVFLADAPRIPYFEQLFLAAFQAQDWEVALLAADALQRHAPDSADTWFYVGAAYTGVDPERSIAAYERAIELDPDFAQPHASLATWMQMRGDFERSARLHERAIALTAEGSRERRRLRLARTQVLAQSGFHDEALAVCGRALAEEPGAVDVLLRKAELLLELELEEEAEEVLMEVLEIEPENATARALLGS